MRDDDAWIERDNRAINREVMRAKRERFEPVFTNQERAMTTVVEREHEVAADAADELAVFRKQDAIVAELREKYMVLTINGVDDAKGFKAVHDARMIVKAARVDCEKTRVKLKADVLERGRKIDSEAKRVTALLAPIEEHLEAEENAVVQERERIKAEAEAIRHAIIKQRYDALQAAGYTGDLMAVPMMTNEKFEEVLGVAQAEKAERDRAAEAERQRQAAEQERLRKLEEEQLAARRKAEQEEAEDRRKEQEAVAAERARLSEIQRKQDEEAAKLRAEQERVAAEQAKEAARLRAEQERIESEKREHQRQIELERAKKEAAERARKETEERLAREAENARALAAAEEARLKEEAAAAEAARLKAEAERPHREKIMALADAVDALKAPDGPKHDAVALALSECASRIRGIANGKLSR